MVTVYFFSVQHVTSSSLKPGTHWRQRRQSLKPATHRRQSRPYWRQSRKYRRQSTLSPICRRFRIRLLVAVDIVADSVVFVADTVDSVPRTSNVPLTFVSSMYGAEATRLCRLSTESTVSNSTLSPVCTGLIVFNVALTRISSLLPILTSADIQCLYSDTRRFIHFNSFFAARCYA